MCSIRIHTTLIDNFVTHLGNTRLKSRQPGLTGGLTVLLFANQQDYLYASSLTAGFRVSLLSSLSTRCLKKIHFVIGGRAAYFLLDHFVCMCSR